jgi:phosphoribosylformimino-5-aminoimidazole carboxamide ribotide isomerase
MILFPAIDLKDGQCVRLKLGDMAQATVFNDDPAAQAAKFEAEGFEYLHLVDLNGAFAGKPVNEAAVDAILKTVTIPVQLGGGIRTLAQIEAWFARASAGSFSAPWRCAIRNLFVKQACKLPRPHRRRHRRQGWPRGGRRLGRNLGPDGHRPCQAFC